MASGGAQHGQPHPRHAGQEELGHQVGAGVQGGQRHAAAQGLAVELKEPRLDGEAVRPGHPAFQQGVAGGAPAVAFHGAHRQQIAVGVPGQGHIAVPPDGHEVQRPAGEYRFEQAFPAHEGILHGQSGHGVQRRQTAPGQIVRPAVQPGVVLGKDGAAELGHDEGGQPRGGVLAGAGRTVVEVQPFPQSPAHLGRGHIVLAKGLFQIALQKILLSRRVLGGLPPAAAPRTGAVGGDSGCMGHPSFPAWGKKKTRGRAFALPRVSTVPYYYFKL